MSLQEIIDGCKNNNRTAQRHLYEHFAPAMLSLCTRYTGNADTARDTMQDGFMKVFTKIRDYNASGSFEGWVRKIFVNTAIESLRKQKNEKQVDLLEIDMENDDYSIFESLSADDLLNLIGGLPTTFRTIFNLRAIEGYSYEEISKTLDIKEVALRTQFMRARIILQKKVENLFK
jgi:RNA polymerase sigma-70 factor (ECF subfamily)